MRIVQYILTALLFVLCSFVSNGQNNTIDSLKQVLQTQKVDTAKVNVLNSIALILIDTVLDNSGGMQYAKNALSISEEIHYQKGSGEAHNIIGKIYYRQSKYSEALENFLSAKQYMEMAGYKLGTALSYDWIGYVYITIGNYSEALKNFQIALRIYKEIDNKSRMARMYQLISGVHFFEGEKEEAVRINLEGLRIMDEIGDKKGMAQSFLNNGEIYLDNNQHEKAIEQFQNAIRIYEKIEGIVSNGKTGDYYVLYTKVRIGKVYEKQGGLALASGDKTTAKNRFLEARMNYLNFLPRADQSNDNEDKILAYQNVGLINLKLNNFSTAKIFLQKSLALSAEMENYLNLMESHKSLTQLDSAVGDFKNAFEHHKLYVLFRDSIDNQESRKKFLQTKMQNEFFERETLAKNEQAKKDAEVKRIRNLQYTVIGFFLLLAIFLFWNNRQKQRSKTKIEKAYTELKATQQQLIQSEKMASLGELTAGIAHEIQNPLNFVNNFSDVNQELLSEMKDEMDKGNIKDAKEIANDIIDNEQKINHHGKRADAIVKNMLQHSRSSSGKKEPTDINVLADEYLRLAYHGLRAKDKSFNATMKTAFDDSIGKINIIPQDIGRVILNLINNAFYAVSEKQKNTLTSSALNRYEPVVTISTKTVKPPLGGLGSKVEISVKDNGKGIPQKIVDKIFQPFFTTKPTGQGTGLGLSLAYDIVTKGHGGELKVETKEGEGSEFIIQLPNQSS
jgi:two-component system, NtrC family, sensor kinase